jgi:ParB family chromosome partitioning protein
MSLDEKKGKKTPPPRISSYAVKVEEKTAEFEKKLELLQESQNEKSKLKNLKINDILNPKFHDRTAPSKASILELSKNIKAVGLQQPIVVRKLENGLFERIIGYRRIEAMKLLEENEIPAIVLENISDNDAMLMMVSENLQRENLNVYDETVALLEYIAVSIDKTITETKSFLFKIKNFYGSKIKDITEEEKETHDFINAVLQRTGKYSIQTFINRLRVLNLDEIIIVAMRENKITYSVAIELQKLKDSTKVSELINEISENGMTTKEIIDRVGQLNGGKERTDSSLFVSLKNLLKESNYKKLSKEKKEEIQTLVERIQLILNV